MKRGSGSFPSSRNRNGKAQALTTGSNRRSHCFVRLSLFQRSKIASPSRYPGGEELTMETYPEVGPGIPRYLLECFRKTLVNTLTFKNRLRIRLIAPLIGLAVSNALRSLCKHPCFTVNLHNWHRTVCF